MTVPVMICPRSPSGALSQLPNPHSNSNSQLELPRSGLQSLLPHSNSNSKLCRRHPAPSSIFHLPQPRRVALRPTRPTMQAPSARPDGTFPSFSVFALAKTTAHSPTSLYSAASSAFFPFSKTPHPSNTFPATQTQPRAVSAPFCVHLIWSF